MKHQIVFVFLLICGFCMTVLAQTQAVVTSKIAQFRTRSTKSAKIILTVKKGAKFKLEDTRNMNGWYYVSVLNGNQKGWIEAASVKILDSSDEVDFSILDDDIILDELIKEDERWKIIREDDKSVFLVDTYTLKEQWGVRIVWIKYVPKNTPVKRIAYSLELNHYNCPARTTQIQSITYYNSKYELLRTDDSAQELVNIIPSSVGEVLFLRICSWKLK